MPGKCIVVGKGARTLLMRLVDHRVGGFQDRLHVIVCYVLNSFSMLLWKADHIALSRLQPTRHEAGHRFGALLFSTSMKGLYRYPEDYALRSAAELDLALSAVPAYRDWRAADPGPQTPLDERYAALPLLDKAHLRTHGLEGFIAPGHELAESLARGAIDTVSTSGTTDEQVVLTWNQAWWNASEALSWTLNRRAAEAGVGDHAEALLTSPLSTGAPSPDGTPLPMHRRRLGRFLYLNEHLDSSAWSDAHIRRMVHELDAFRPVVLEGSPTLLARFARRSVELGLRCWQPRLIVTSYEFPSRALLRQVRCSFGAPIISSYGCTEAGCVLTQCEAGCFHQNSAFVRVEFQPLAARFAKPGVGRIALTSFGNLWRVLLRFDVGDLIRLRPPETPCACGRTGGIVADVVEGRVQDVTFGNRGQLVTVDELDRRASGVEDVLEHQVTQDATGKLTACVVCSRDRTIAELAAALGDLYGGRVGVSRVASIPAEVSGKHRLARCAANSSGTMFEGPMRAP